ncbi:thioesterase family protein [Sutterella sp.]|uniref:acyl-CoA thioesterase n=1 Tax=Sutterella sp. TaxID=1981025 RepID=UPI0026DF80CF|nr:thioesterase family protein [Sutterella sp.]MDO5530611.1 thioesterase family protein [Sutterella sp.]
MPHLVYERPIRIHFGDCDPAGIVYHPHYYALINMFHEDFLHEVGNVGFIEIRKFGVGFPVVGIRTDFTAPSRPGDLCTGKVWIEKMGRSSIRFAFEVTCGEEVRLRAIETMVCVKLDEKGDFVSYPIPDNIREAFKPYLIEEGDPLLELRA